MGETQSLPWEPQSDLKAQSLPWGAPKSQGGHSAFPKSNHPLGGKEEAGCPDWSSSPVPQA